MQNHFTKKSGFTLVEVIIVSALTTLVFGALFSSFQYSLRLINYSRAKLSAMAVATERMEYFRSLPYTDVGTISGIPSGTIAQNSTTTLNGINFHERVLVEYIDDAADGLDAADSNGILADYKRIKLEYSWQIGEESNQITLVSNIVPRSIETTAGGGSVRINVINDQSLPLPGASVRLINNTIVPNIDVTKITDANGAALFSGAPAGSDYEVIVNGNIAGNDYSTAQTYEVTVANPTPTVSPFTVVEADISTLTFQIGELSDLNISTLSAVSENMFREEFSDLAAVAFSNQVVAAANKLQLTNTAGVYAGSGSAYLGPISPSPLLKWQSARVAVDLPVDTSHKIQFFTGAGVGPYTIIPDSDLPGNAAGFTSTNIDISSLDSGAYPSIFVGITLETSDTSKTPAIDEISVFYRQSESVLASTNFDMVGTKIIGTDGGGLPILKYDNSHTTDAGGELTITDLEFDNYTLTASGYDMAIACSNHPFIQQAGVDGDLELVLVASAANTLRVSVLNSAGQVIPGAEVRLSRPSYDTTHSTGGCGQVFFTGGLSVNSDYEITVTATGYNTETVSAFSISGDTVTTITLTE